MTDAQRTTLANLGLQEADAKPYGASLTFPWAGDTILVVNAHGSTSVYPVAVIDHAIQGHQ